MRARTALGGIIVAILLTGAWLVARRHEVVAALLPRIIGAATGYDVSIGQERFGVTHGALLHVHVSKHGEPVLDAARIDIWYSVRDLLPGSKHRYGINALAVDAPRLTLVRHQDGSYNVSLPQAAAPASASPQRPNAVPIALTIRIRDGSGALRAPYALDVQSRNIDVDGVSVTATIDSAARTHYNLRGAFVERRNEPFTAMGTIDMDRAFAMHRIRASSVPMRAIANYFINSHAARVLGGTASNLDVRAYALDVQPGASIAYHISGGLDITEGSMGITGIALPIARINGHMGLVDNAFFASNLAAQLAGVPVIVNGGIIRFSAPQYRLGIVANGDLRTLRKAFAFSAQQDVSGAAKIAVLVQGDLGSPEVLVRMDASHVRYRTIPMQKVHAVIAYEKSTVTIAPLEATLGRARATVRGMLSIGDNVHSELSVHVRGSAQDLPYAGELLGKEPVSGDFVLDGGGTDFAASGTLQSERSIEDLSALVRLQRGGVLDVAPFWLHAGGGTIDGAYHLNRTRDDSAFWLSASRVALHVPSYPTDFGYALPQLPAIEGSVDRLELEGGGPSGLHALVSGMLRAHDTTIANVKLTHLQATFAGSLTDAAVDPIAADGPWGSLLGKGAFSLHALAVRGAYHGTLEGLRPFLVGTPAGGHVDGVAALAIAPGRITVQAENVALAGAQVRGMPLRSVRGTLFIEDGNVHVDSAQATLSGGDVVAAGAYASGIALVAAHLDGAHVRGLGLPLDAGTVSASGRVSHGLPLPSFVGGVSVASGRAQRYSVTGSGLVNLHGDRAHLTHVVGAVDGMYAYADGDITRLTSGTPGYALHARIPAADVSGALRALALPAYLEDGTFNADFAVDGSGLEPRVRGPLGVPAGAVNGLPFVDGSAMLVASPGGITARAGAVQVGSTHLAFLAGRHPRISGLHVRSAAADLSDFNNFFDTGDTLAGTGSLRFDVISQLHRISSNGSLAIDGFRYRNLAIGDSRASWSSKRSVVAGSLLVNGTSGALHARGSVALATDRPWQEIVGDSNYNVALQLENVDLSTWVAALGFPQVPVTGHVGASGEVRGRFPELALNGSVQLKDGTIWRLPIAAASLAFASRGNRLNLTSGTLTASGLSATATGDLGLGLNDPLHVNVYVTSDDVPTLIAQLYRKDLPITGDFESTLTVGGTLAKPTFAAAFDATQATIYGVKVPLIFGSLQLKGTELELRNAGAQFERGDISLAGTLPLNLQPFAIGPPKAPVSFDLAVDGLDPGTFDSLFGHGTKLGGAIDGRVGISGTVAQPRIFGSFGIAGGSYASDFELTPITAIAGTLRFSRTDASVDSFTARLGTGSIAGSGAVAFSKGITFNMHALAHGAQLNSPQLGSGTIDGALAFERAGGGQAELSGSASLSNAAIPFAAFLAATQHGAGAQAPSLPFGVGFDLALSAGKNVRVRGSGYGAGLDIGATGAVRLAGTLAAPTLQGAFAATGGTLTYFDRAFRVQSATVSFDPASGILPTLHATGTTHVTNPDPDTARNPYGSSDVTIDVSGPINAMRVAFSSNPPGYSNDQILAMIAPFGGLVGVPSYAPGLNPSVNGVQPLGALSPVPGARTPGELATNSTVSVGQEAFNILNAQFAAGLLSPFESALSSSLGFQNVNVTVDYYGNVGVQASKVLGRTVNLIYSTSFGIPVRQSIGIQLLGGRNTSAQLSLYLQNGNTSLFRTETAVSSNAGLAVGEPLQGSSGFAFTLQRLYW